MCEEIAERGEQPARRKSLEVTDPEHIDRLPSTILCDISYSELVDTITEANQRTGSPDSVEGRPARIHATPNGTLKTSHARSSQIAPNSAGTGAPLVARSRALEARPAESVGA